MTNYNPSTIDKILKKLSESKGTIGITIEDFKKLGQNDYKALIYHLNKREDIDGFTLLKFDESPEKIRFLEMSNVLNIFKSATHLKELGLYDIDDSAARCLLKNKGQLLKLEGLYLFKLSNLSKDGLSDIVASVNKNTLKTFTLEYISGNNGPDALLPLIQDNQVLEAFEVNSRMPAKNKGAEVHVTVNPYEFFEPQFRSQDKLISALKTTKSLKSLVLSPVDAENANHLVELLSTISSISHLYVSYSVIVFDTILPIPQIAKDFLADSIKIAENLLAEIENDPESYGILRFGSPIDYRATVTKKFAKIADLIDEYCSQHKNTSHKIEKGLSEELKNEESAVRFVFKDGSRKFNCSETDYDHFLLFKEQEIDLIAQNPHDGEL